MGCMSSIVMLLKEPDMFAGALLVAGKWNPALMGPLAKQNVWIISCEGDASSNTLQGQAVELWRSEGRGVTEATWALTTAAADCRCSIRGAIGWTSDAAATTILST